MISSKEILNIRPKHSALTKYMRRKGGISPQHLNDILYRCDVSQNVGELPRLLRKIVARADIRDKTDAFHNALRQIFVQNRELLDDMECEVDYELPQISQIFNTPCFFKHSRTWSGISGTVYKISFPAIGADYALKLFREYDMCAGKHGAAVEIPAAFGANHAEPQRNASVYMASFGMAQYMLSEWMGDYADDIMPQDNKYEIFATASAEIFRRNYRWGCRIDFGRTYQTPYGAAPYRVRKQYRKIMNVLKNVAPDDEVPAELQAIFAKTNTYPQYLELLQAVELFKKLCPTYMWRFVSEYENRYKISR